MVIVRKLDTTRIRVNHRLARTTCRMRLKVGEGRATGKSPEPADKNVCATCSAGFPACGFWGHSCPQVQELRPHPLLITPPLSRASLRSPEASNANNRGRQPVSNLRIVSPRLHGCG